MNLNRYILFLLVLFLASNTVLHAKESDSENVFKLAQQPNVRIGLLRNSYSATITTREPSLIAQQDGEPIQKDELPIINVLRNGIKVASNFNYVVSDSLTLSVSSTMTPIIIEV